MGVDLWGVERRSFEHDQVARHESIKELIKTLKDLGCFDNSPHPPSLVPGCWKSKVTPVVQGTGWTVPGPRVCKQHLYWNPCEHKTCTNPPSCSAGGTTQASYLSCGLSAHQCAEEHAKVSCWGLSAPCLVTKKTSLHFGRRHMLRDNPWSLRNLHNVLCLLPLDYLVKNKLQHNALNVLHLDTCDFSSDFLNYTCSVIKIKEDSQSRGIRWTGHCVKFGLQHSASVSSEL